MNLRNTINEVLTEILKIDASHIGNNDDLMKLGLDSISFIKLILLFEEKLGVEINDADVMILYFKTISDIEQTLSKYV